ncbi:MAG: hypothetical protein AAF335_04635 [Bacteroidota bacterium]
MTLSNKKTSIKHIDNGVDFLGFNIRQYSNPNKKTGQLVWIKPSKESIKRFKREVKILFRKVLGKPLVSVIKQINQKIKET